MIPQMVLGRLGLRAARDAGNVAARDAGNVAEQNDAPASELSATLAREARFALSLDGGGAVLSVVKRSGFHKEYTLESKLGQGAYGSVYTAQSTENGRQVAVKVMAFKKQKKSGPCFRRRAANREYNALRIVSAIGSPNLVGHLDAFYENGCVYFLMEKCEQSLLQHLESIPLLTERSLAPVVRQMLQGLSALHAAGVVHRDVKPDNFLCDQDCVKLCDFGLACATAPLDRIQLTGCVGTPAFMAPELMLGKYNSRVDIWAIGTLMYTLFFGQFPYEPKEKTGFEMMACIAHGHPAPVYVPLGGRRRTTCTAAAERLVRFLLVRRPAWRPSADEALCHKFFAQSSGEAPETEEAEERVSAAISAGANLVDAPLRAMLQECKRIGVFGEGAPPAAAKAQGGAGDPDSLGDLLRPPSAAPGVSSLRLTGRKLSKLDERLASLQEQVLRRQLALTGCQPGQISGGCSDSTRGGEMLPALSDLTSTSN